MSPPQVRHDMDAMCANAAFLFANGRVHEASITWHGVIRRLLPLLTSDLKAVDATAPPPSPTTPQAQATAALVPASPLRGAFVVLPLDATSSSLSGPAMTPSSTTALTSEDRTFSLYASALQYVPPEGNNGLGGRLGSGGGGGRRLEDDMALAATVLYNLGLCHHLQAVWDGSRASTLFDKALRAYNASQQIVEASGLRYLHPEVLMDDDDASFAVGHHLRGVSLLLLATTNNAGHVFEQLQRRHHAEHQLEVLHVLLASLDDGRPWTAMPSEDVGGNPAAAAAHSSSSSVVLLSYGAEPFVPFFLTAAMYPFRHKIGTPAPCA